jgi:hypothetical protein
MLDDVSAQRISDGLGVLVGPVQEILEAEGGGLATGFCHLPPVLALGLTEQALQICRDPLAGLRAREIWSPSPRYVCQVGQAARYRPGHRLNCRRVWSLSHFIDLSHGSILLP